MKKEEFRELCKNTVVLDGGTGSWLMAHGMPRGTCTEKWILENPDVLIDLQKSYVDAGSQILCAPTFGANRINLSMHGLEKDLKEMNLRLVETSRKAVGDRAFLAGDMSTFGKMMAPNGEMTYDLAYELYSEQIQALVEAGVDVLLAETMINIDEMLAMIDASTQICDLPILCSMTVDADGSLFSGGNIYDAVAAFEAAGADAVGINCSVGPDQMTTVIRNIKETVSIPVIAKPNAGLPFITDAGQAVYSMGPEDFAEHMMVLKQNGADIIGGCCGTNPDYIRAVKQKLINCQ